MAAPLHAPKNGTYSVPQRFGISAILALTTLFAFVFAGLRAFNAPTVLYLFFGTLAVTICLAQMVFGQVPRLSSIASGALLLPFWVFVIAIWEESAGGGRNAIGWAVGLAPFTLIAGAILGYLAGTVMAGFFLLLDLTQSPKAAGAKSAHQVTEPLAAEIVEKPAPLSAETRE
jgi:hypothetical protein